MALLLWWWFTLESPTETERGLISVTLKSISYRRLWNDELHLTGVCYLPTDRGNTQNPNPPQSHPHCSPLFKYHQQWQSLDFCWKYTLILKESPAKELWSIFLPRFQYSGIEFTLVFPDYPVVLSCPRLWQHRCLAVFCLPTRERSTEIPQGWGGQLISATHPRGFQLPGEQGLTKLLVSSKQFIQNSSLRFVWIWNSSKTAKYESPMKFFLQEGGWFNWPWNWELLLGVSRPLSWEFKWKKQENRVQIVANPSIIFLISQKTRGFIVSGTNFLSRENSNRNHCWPGIENPLQMSFSERAEFQLSSMLPVKDSTVSSAHKPLSFNASTHTQAQQPGILGFLCGRVALLGTYRIVQGQNCEAFGFSEHLLKLFLLFLQLVFNSIAKSSSCPRTGETKNLEEQSPLLILNKKSCTSDEGGTDQTEKTLKAELIPVLKKKKVLFPQHSGFAERHLGPPTEIKGITHCMNKDSPESIIIWHKMERSGFLQPQVSVWKMLTEGYPGWNWSINAMGRHLQHPTETSWRKRAPRLRPALDWLPPCQLNPDTAAVAWTHPGHKHTPLNPSEHLCISIPPQEWRDSVPTALGKKEFSSAPACNWDHCSEMALAKNSTRQGFKPDLQNSLPNTGKPFRMQWQLWNSDWLGKMEQSLWKNI